MSFNQAGGRRQRTGWFVPSAVAPEESSESGDRVAYPEFQIWRRTRCSDREIRDRCGAADPAPNRLDDLLLRSIEKIVGSITSTFVGRQHHL